MSEGNGRGTAPGPSAAGPADGEAAPWLAWTALAIAAIATALFAWRALYGPRGGRRFFAAAKAVGTFHRVQEVSGPVALRMDDGTAVRLAGIAEPTDAAEADLAKARLSELAPPGTLVYVEIEPVRLGGAPPGKYASVYVPPDGAGRSGPFPYEDSRLVNATLVQGGLVRADSAQLYRYANEFEMLQDDARRNQRGIWSGPAAEQGMGASAGE